jgi:hypothetical protein
MRSELSVIFFVAPEILRSAQNDIGILTKYILVMAYLLGKAQLFKPY